MRTIGPAISIAFLALSAWMLLNSSTPMPPLPAVVPIDPSDIDPSPRREVFADPPTLRVAGYDQRCSECHRLFESSSHTPAQLARHENVVLEHGLNDRCLNCHSTQDRDKLILHGELEIGYDRVTELCAKCHGPTWRDWEKGMHGRTTGSWRLDSPARSRLICTQCHDPHRPALAPIRPLRGPNTLRMGERHRLEPQQPGPRTSPLLRRTSASKPQGDTPPEPPWNDRE